MNAKQVLTLAVVASLFLCPISSPCHAAYDPYTGEGSVNGAGNPSVNGPGSDNVNAMLAQAGVGQQSQSPDPFKNAKDPNNLFMDPKTGKISEGKPEDKGKAKTKDGKIKISKNSDKPRKLSSDEEKKKKELEKKLGDDAKNGDAEAVDSDIQQLSALNGVSQGFFNSSQGQTDDFGNKVFSYDNGDGTTSTITINRDGRSFDYEMADSSTGNPLASAGDSYNLRGYKQSGYSTSSEDAPNAFKDQEYDGSTSTKWTPQSVTTTETKSDGTVDTITEKKPAADDFGGADWSKPTTEKITKNGKLIGADDGKGNTLVQNDDGSYTVTQKNANGTKEITMQDSNIAGFKQNAKDGTFTPVDSSNKDIASGSLANVKEAWFDPKNPDNQTYSFSKNTDANGVQSIKTWDSSMKGQTYEATMTPIQDVKGNITGYRVNENGPNIENATKIIDGNGTFSSAGQYRNGTWTETVPDQNGSGTLQIKHSYTPDENTQKVTETTTTTKYNLEGKQIGDAVEKTSDPVDFKIGPNNPSSTQQGAPSSSTPTSSGQTAQPGTDPLAPKVQTDLEAAKKKLSDLDKPWQTAYDKWAAAGRPTSGQLYNDKMALESKIDDATKNLAVQQQYSDTRPLLWQAMQADGSNPALAQSLRDQAALKAAQSTYDADLERFNAASDDAISGRKDSDGKTWDDTASALGKQYTSDLTKLNRAKLDAALSNATLDSQKSAQDIKQLLPTDPNQRAALMNDSSYQSAYQAAVKAQQELALQKAQVQAYQQAEKDGVPLSAADRQTWGDLRQKTSTGVFSDGETVQKAQSTKQNLIGLINRAKVKSRSQ